MISRLHDENDDKRWGERKRGCVTYINQKESERTNHNQTNQLKLLLLLLQLLFCPFTFIHWCQIQKKLALCLNFKPLITTTIIIIIIIINIMSSSLKVNPLSNTKKSKQVQSRRKENHKTVTEDDLLKKDFITPEDVCNLDTISKGYYIFYIFFIVLFFFCFI